MKSRSSKPEASDLCASLRPEDGIPPIELKKLQRSSRANNKSDHRARQFEKAAARALDWALTAECSEPPLDCLSLHHVELAPHGSVLNVALLAQGRQESEMAELEPLVQGLAVRLRSALALAINRRRTPHVRLHLIPEGWAEAPQA